MTTREELIDRLAWFQLNRKPLTEKALQRETLQSQVDEYLSRGGVIEQVPIRVGDLSTDRNFHISSNRAQQRRWNKSITPAPDTSEQSQSSEKEE
jgi:hypothetical protein